MPNTCCRDMRNDVEKRDCQPEKLTNKQKPLKTLNGFFISGGEPVKESLFSIDASFVPLLQALFRYLGMIPNALG